MVFVEGYKLTYLAAVVLGLLVLSFGVAHAYMGGEKKNSMDWYIHTLYIQEWNWA